MSRPLRLEYPGAIWHVTSRGNEKRDIFRDDADRHDWLRLLEQTVVMHGWRLHGYVLMGNHYHLLVETPSPTLSRGMRHLNGVYAQRFNRRHGRTGHLFQGRFHAILVQRESHLLELLRYVVLNPVRAGLVQSPGEWRWSSYHATVGDAYAPAWLETQWTLEQFGGGIDAARRRYREFVAEGAGVRSRPWSAVRGQIYLGSDAFVHGARAEAEERTRDHEIPRVQREDALRVADVLPVVARALAIPADAMREARKVVPERAIVAYTLRRFAAASCTVIAAHVGVSTWRAAALARVGEARCKRDVIMAARVETAVRLARPIDVISSSDVRLRLA